jgi:hypothetical protein
MACRVFAIVVCCKDVETVSDFWAAALEYDLGVSNRRLLTQTPRAEALSRRAARGFPVLKSGIDRPGGRIFSADSSLACRCPVDDGLLPRPLADKPAPRC